MKRVKSSVSFLVVILVSIMVPAALANKLLYNATIVAGKECGNKLGSAVIYLSRGEVSFDVNVVTEGAVAESVLLIPRDGSKVLPLCGEPGAVNSRCSYDDRGNLDISGTITSSALIANGITGAQFSEWLKECQLTIVVQWEGFETCVSSGLFSRTIPYNPTPCRW